MIAIFGFAFFFIQTCVGHVSRDIFGESSSFSSASTYETPADSAVFYTELSSENAARWLTFELGPEDEHALCTSGKPDGEMDSDFWPMLCMVSPLAAKPHCGPGEANWRVLADTHPNASFCENLTSTEIDIILGGSHHIVPDGYQISCLRSSRNPNPKTSQEPFSPGVAIGLGAISAMNAPKGQYWCAVMVDDMTVLQQAAGEHADDGHAHKKRANPDDHSSTPNRVYLVIGYLERFSAMDLFTFGVGVWNSHVWARDSLALLLLPGIFGFLLSFSILMFFFNRRTFDDASKPSLTMRRGELLFSLAGSAYVGSAVDKLALFLATLRAEKKPLLGVAFVLILVHNLFSIGPLHTAIWLRSITNFNQPAADANCCCRCFGLRLSLWRRVGLLVSALASLFLFGAGFFFGGFLTGLTALLPDYVLLAPWHSFDVSPPITTPKPPPSIKEVSLGSDTASEGNGKPSNRRRRQDPNKQNSSGRRRKKRTLQ